VEITHAALANVLASFAEAPGLRAGDRLLAITTIGFDMSVVDLFAPLVVGATIELASREAAQDPHLLGRLLSHQGPIACQATPYTWRMLVEAGWQGNPHLRALSGAEALTRDLADALLDRSGEVWNLYGPTECAVWVTRGRVERSGQVSVGRPMDNTRILVLDERQQVAPFGVEGEVYVGGPNVGRGYRRRPELTAQAFVTAPSDGRIERLYRTGDRGRLRPDGHLELAGRLDALVKIRGAAVEPAEVVAALNEHAAILESVVHVHPDPDGRPALTAYYVPRGEDPGARVLRAHLQDRLPAFMVPALLMSIPTIPRLHNGKLDRARLPAPAFSPGDGVRREPADAIERLTLSIFHEVLAGGPFGPTDDFFDAGGHSLLATRAVARLEQETGYRIPLAKFFRNPTAAQLAHVLRAAKTDGPQA
jgi:acyl-coenzyme A synthetase/AMP-(fatty) acid ligase